MLAIAVLPLSVSGETAPTYRLAFPAIALEKDERIDALKIEVHCGYIKSLLSVPEDWSFEVRTISRVATLQASAGHGASWLWDIRPWNRVVAIQSYDASCFDLTATVYSTFYEERNRERIFNRRQLKLVP